MRNSLLALALATAMTPLVAAAPAAAQNRADQYRWEQAQRRFANEQAIFEQERARYESTRRGRGGYGRGGGGRYGWKEGPDWEPSRYYREDPNYQERQLSSQDEVYRGEDGRYYCRRSDGTTGLVIGAGVGALVGRGIDTRGERATGTIVGGVLGALVGRQVERSQDLRCR
jgi:Glycine zipper 2TM domain